MRNTPKRVGLDDHRVTDDALDGKAATIDFGDDAIDDCAHTSFSALFTHGFIGGGLG